MEDSKNPFRTRLDSTPPIAPQEAIAQSIATRESSRAARLHRTLETVLSLTRSNPPATNAALDQLLVTILDALIVATEAPMGSLQIFDPTTQSLHLRAHRGFSSPFVEFFREVKEANTSCGAAFAKGKPEVVDDVAVSPVFSEDCRKAVLDAGVRSCQSLAIVAAGKKLGAVSVHYPHPGIPAHKCEAFANAAPLIARLVEAGLQGSPFRAQGPGKA